MAWLDLIFGVRGKSASSTREPLRWTSRRGDDWWCDDASAGYGCGNFTIGSFGSFTAPSLAMELIRHAREAFPDATIDIYLDPSTEAVVRTLQEQGLLKSQVIELSPRTRVARVEDLHPNDSSTRG